MSGPQLKELNLKDSALSLNDIQIYCCLMLSSNYLDIVIALLRVSIFATSWYISGSGCPKGRSGSWHCALLLHEVAIHVSHSLLQSYTCPDTYTQPAVKQGTLKLLAECMYAGTKQLLAV
jgi:hypothetical protein